MTVGECRNDENIRRATVNRNLTPAAKIIAIAVAALTLSALALACRPPPVPDAPYVPLTRPAPATTAPTPTPTPTPTAAPTPSATPLPYDANRNMYRIWSGVGHRGGDTLAALAAADMQRDVTQVPVILESLRFMHLNGARAAVRTLATLTGGDFAFDLNEWTQMGEWLGRNRAAYPPPSRYPEWKVNVLETIDPEMAALLRPALTDGGVAVNLTEIMWGGVRVDGIPPLEHPPHIAPASAAEWLLSDDRVFGVSINGEHRAYPLRIMNAHELANDTLGGEPISLVY